MGHSTSLCVKPLEGRSRAGPNPGPLLCCGHDHHIALTDTERAYLRSQPLGRLATVDASGAPQNSPIGLFLDEETGDIIIVGLVASPSHRVLSWLGLPAWAVTAKRSSARRGCSLA